MLDLEEGDAGFGGGGMMLRIRWALGLLFG
jgi:hypothetical protein